MFLWLTILFFSALTLKKKMTFKTHVVGNTSETVSIRVQPCLSSKPPLIVKARFTIKGGRHICLPSLQTTIMNSNDDHQPTPYTVLGPQSTDVVYSCDIPLVEQCFHLSCLRSAATSLYSRVYTAEACDQCGDCKECIIHNCLLMLDEIVDQSYYNPTNKTRTIIQLEMHRRMIVKILEQFEIPRDVELLLQLSENLFHRAFSRGLEFDLLL